MKTKLLNFINYYLEDKDKRPSDTGEDTTTYGREFDESQFGGNRNK